MRAWISLIALAHCALQASTVVAHSVAARVSEDVASLVGRSGKITPKVFIIDMVRTGLAFEYCFLQFKQFTEEGEAWYGIPDFNLLARNITVPGFSPLFPDAHCTADGSICQVVTGEGEINAAATMSALVYSSIFDLKTTYFLVAGIGGISPKMGTLGSVTFARYAVQVGLQFEIDAREMPSNFTTGYVPQGAFAPGQYPTRIYGTEVYELNERLRDLAVEMAKQATLFDDEPSKAYRANYANNTLFKQGASPPSIVACDTATSDIFWSGVLIGEAMENATSLFTNGTAQYCMSQQEDNATLEALIRAAVLGLVDFSRIIIMRTGSDFDRQFDGQTAADNLFFGLSGFVASITNLQIAGVQVVRGILAGWERVFEKGVKPANYVGDILGSLGGQPDFGPGSVFGGKRAPARRRFIK